MIKWKTWICMVMVVVLSSCDDSTVQPKTQPAETPAGFSDLLIILNIDDPALLDVAESIAAGDSAAAAEALFSHFRHKEKVPVPQYQFSDPVTIAAILLSGSLHLLPHEPTVLLQNPEWTEDPFNNSNWRFQYHCLSWLMPMFQAYELSGDVRYLERFLYLIEDYATDNVMNESQADMTWYDMAAAKRTENLLFTLQRLLDLDLIDRDGLISYLSWLEIHGRQLENLIVYDFDSNHGVFHNRSLILSGLVLPEFLAAESRFNLGLNRITDQTMNMISAEGVYFEASFSYHFYMYDILSEVQDILENIGLTLPGESNARIEAMPLFGAHILKPRGEAPMIGDTAAHLFLSPLLNMNPYLDYSLTLGATGMQPPVACADYSHSGYAIFRSGWGERRPFNMETHAVFDMSPLGGWHGHHDGLSFTLAAFGENLVVDSGSSSFYPPWRDFFTSHRAHNLLTLAGDMTQPVFEPNPLLWREEDDNAVAAGWMKLSETRDWIRYFIYLKPDDFLIIDMSIGDSVESVDYLLHFAPEAQVVTGERSIRVSSNNTYLDLFFAGNPDLLIMAGEQDPLQGWYSVAYGEQEPNPVMRARKSGVGLEFTSLLHVHQGEDDLLDFKLLDRDGQEYYSFLIDRVSGSEEIEIWLPTGRVIRHER